MKSKIRYFFIISFIVLCSIQFNNFQTNNQSSKQLLANTSNDNQIPQQKISGTYIPSNGKLLDFEAVPNGNLNTYVSYVSFSPGWSIWSSAGTGYPPHSGAMVIFSHEIFNWINFSIPQNFISVYFSTQYSNTLNITAFDQNGFNLTQATIPAYAQLYEVNLTSPSIYSIRISGTGSNWFNSYAIDDLFFSNDDGVKLNFENSPPNNDINNYSSYVNFSAGWQIWNSSGSLYPSHSGSMVIYTHESFNWINFTVPQDYIHTYFSTYAGGNLYITAYDEDGFPLVTATVPANASTYPVSLISHRIFSLRITGVNSGWESSYVIDDLYFDNSTGKLLNFESTPPGGSLNNYANGISFSPGWQQWNSTGSSFTSHSGSMVIYTHESFNWINFTTSQSYIEMFVSSQSGGKLYLNAYDKYGVMVDSATIPANAQVYKANVSNTNIYSIRIVGNTTSWESSYTIDDLYFVASANPTVHSLSQPIISYPSYYQSVSGIITIQYSPAIDSLGHNVFYNLTITNSNSETFQLISFTSLTFYQFNTASYQDAYYVLDVTAFDNYGLISQASVPLLFSNAYTTTIGSTTSAIGSTTQIITTISGPSTSYSNNPSTSSSYSSIQPIPLNTHGFELFSAFSLVILFLHRQRNKK